MTYLSINQSIYLSIYLFELKQVGAALSFLLQHIIRTNMEMNTFFKNQGLKPD